ncbi:MAG: TonB-dependent receptor [Hydrogenophaga sp.]|nr:TonB-dependent receptor [Hydrogenophaga sp.]
MTLSDTLRLTLGSKFEHNETTGLETQPSARLHWRASPTDTVWAAVSRAVETPSRSTLDSQINYRVEPPGSPFNIPGSPFPMVVGLRGHPGLVSQELVARELGYRGLFGRHLSVDLTVFHNQYEKLVTAEGLRVVPGMPSSATYGFANGLSGRTHGVELSSVWQVHPRWRLSGSLSTLRMKLTPDPSNSAFGAPGASPSRMAQLHVQHDLGQNLEADAHLYRNARLPDLNIPAHTRLDLRLGWRVHPALKLSLTGRNLLQRSHAEFRADDLQASTIRRSWLLQALWKF